MAPRSLLCIALKYLNMRILIATGLYPPEIGGPATYAKFFEDELPKNDIEVEILPFSNVRHLPKVIRHFAYLWKLIRMSRSADAILVQDTVSTGVPAAIASKITRLPLIVRVPGDYAWEQGRQRFGVKENLDDFQDLRYGPMVGLFRALQEFTVRSATRVIAPSEYLANIVVRWVNPNQEVSIVYNGVELPLVVSEPEKRPDEDLVVSVGRLVPWKGFDSLINIVNKEENWFLAIIGDGPLKEKLGRNAGKRVMLKGKLPRDETLGWCKEADVFVLNSSYEGLSHTLLEVMALGVPIVATNVGGNPELIEDGVHGLLVESGNDKALHDAIEKLVNDKNLAKKLGENAKVRAEDFSIDYTVEATSEVLRDAIYLPPKKGEYVLMISTDRNIFIEDSKVRNRMKKYGGLFDELHIIVFTKRADNFKPIQICENTWIHPTNSHSRWLYVIDAIRIGRKTHSANIVTTQDPFETGLAGSLIYKKLGARLHVQVHTDVMSSEFVRGNFINRIRRIIASWIIPKADCIRTVSRRIERGIEVKYRPLAEVSILPIFVNLREFKKIEHKKHSRFNTTLLVVSRLEIEKNVSLAIRALHQVRRAGNDAGLIIVGSGNQKKKLRILVEELGLEQWVEFAGWKDPHEFYGLADIVLVTSKYEGFGITIIESLAAGVPVLSTDVGIAHEAGAIVTKEKNYESALVEWFKNGSRQGKLLFKPYKSEKEYLLKYKSDIARCI
jgi:glycosyltransferase involved in cell wall biosynthesis